MSESHILTAYKSGQIAQIWQQKTQTLIDQCPQWSPLRCGELVAAELAKQAGNEYAVLESKVNPFCMSDQEVELYDWLADDNYNIKEDLINLSGTRTLLADMGNLDKCPACGSANPLNEHLIQEYSSMQRAQYGAFKHNARIAQNIIAELLLLRGVTHIPNIFGDILIEVQA